MPSDTILVPSPPASARGRLSARLVGQLSAGEQFVVWALRQRLRDAVPASPVLVHGFRLAFGLRAMEPGLAAFEGCFRMLASCPAAGGIALCPLRCACLTADEEAVMGLVAGRPAPLAERLVEAVARRELCAHAAALGTLLARAGLALPGALPDDGPAQVH